MSDPLEDELVDWLRTRATPDSVAMADAIAAIDRLPDRRRRRSGWVLSAASFALGIAALALLVPRIGPSPSSIGSSLPDPAAFDDDPRLGLCGPASDGFLTIFEMARIADYPRHLPNAYPLVGLQVDPSAPVLVVVYAGPASWGRGPLRDPPGPSPSDTEHDVCIVVGTGPTTWESAGVARVDITGLRGDLQTANGPDPVTPTTAPTPAASDGVALPDPSPFRDDPRALTCQDHALAVSAFEVAHARDMRLYLPAFSGWEPELLTDEPALVLVMGPDYPAPPYPGPSSAGPPPSSGPTDRQLCIVVGSEPPFATGYRFVAIVGFDAEPAGVGQASDMTEPCPAAWRMPMSLAWGQMEDLLAPREVVQDRRELIDGATALVERTPDWGPGDDARRNLADALEALDRAERAYEAADPAEARALAVAAPLIDVASRAYRDLGAGPSAPCFVDADGGAGG